MTRPNRKGTLSIEAIDRMLSERDRQVLHSLFLHKFLTSNQICRFHFWNHSSAISGTRACNRVLSRLRERGLIYRLDRPVGGHGGGSASFIWALDAAGDRYVRRVNESEVLRGRAFEPTTMFLTHTLEIANVHLTLLESARAGKFVINELQTEPGNWRSFLRRSGAGMTLKPDLFVSISLPEFDDFYFLELDRGTESLSVIVRKCQVYEAHRQSRVEQEKLGVYPFVVWIVPSARRRTAILKAISADVHLDPQLFSVIVSDKLAAYIESGPEGTDAGAGGA